MKVAVVGAGIGGLFTAWRLLRSGKYSEVKVYEGSDRIGGRLLTWFPHDDDHAVRGELGGMRFIPAQHKLVAKLVADLRLESLEFPATTQFTYLRGEHLTRYGAVPYQLRPDERGLAPDALLQKVIATIAAHNGLNLKEMTRQEWDDKKPTLTWKNQLLSTIGFWNVMLDIVSNEGYKFITDGLGYYSLTSNWNAAEALQFIATDFADDPYYTLTDGYSALATTIASEIAEHIQINRSVSSLRRAGRQWELTFAGGGTEQADAVVLGLPGRAMDLVDFPADVKAKLAGLQTALIRVPAFKLFLLYKENWWSYGPGRFTTTLPIRQTYNFNVLPAKPGDTQLMAMATYDDLTAVPYWHGLEHAEAAQPANEGIGEVFHPHRFSGALNQNAATGLPVGFHVAPPGMVKRAQTQLAEATGKAIPAPHASAYMDWSEDPYGGGWSFWAPGTNVARVMAETRQLADSLFVVGDSFSGMQGWVEGALTYTEKLLQEKFELDPYLPGYYVGH